LPRRPRRDQHRRHRIGSEPRRPTRAVRSDRAGGLAGTLRRHTALPDKGSRCGGVGCYLPGQREVLRSTGITIGSEDGQKIAGSVGARHGDDQIEQSTPLRRDVAECDRKRREGGERAAAPPPTSPGHRQRRPPHGSRSAIRRRPWTDRCPTPSSRRSAPKALPARAPPRRERGPQAPHSPPTREPVRYRRATSSHDSVHIASRVPVRDKPIIRGLLLDRRAVQQKKSARGGFAIPGPNPLDNPQLRLMTVP
jgi:hypothetical protein